MAAELQTRRGRTFFWIGLGVFPVFWVWWMNARQFTSEQMRAARVWTGLYVVAVVVAWWMVPEFRMRVNHLPWNYSFIAYEVGVWLWIWLLFRIVKLPANVMGFVIWLDIISMFFHSFRPVLNLLPQHPLALLWILIPATVHLLVEPVRLYEARLKSHLPWYSMNGDLSTQEHERVACAEAMQIAEGYWSRAEERHESEREAMAANTFGFGWEGQFIEFNIKAPDRISCTVATMRPYVPWFLRRWMGKKIREEELPGRDMMMAKIEKFFRSVAAERRR
ncbi:hypothetical protein [Prosthecobacter sp.]|uniref:hypothetical protein n=1 Tax=Prosthecobacter sp. TaxID=1965333 RepID=UPI003782D704